MKKDLHLPEMLGPIFTRHMNNSQNHFPVLMLNLQADNYICLSFVILISWNQ